MTALPFWLPLALLGFKPWMITLQQSISLTYHGITIIWDRLLGTFQSETERVRYGLTENMYTFNPIRVATHEYAAIIRDVRSPDNWPDRFGYVLRGPGWAYERRGLTTTQPHVARAALAPLH